MSIFDNLKPVSNKTNKENIKKNSIDSNFNFSFRKTSAGRKTINFSLSPSLINSLKWEDVERINLYSDGENRFGISKDIKNKGYKLIRNINKANEIIRFEFSLSWNKDICKEMSPQMIQENKEKESHIGLHYSIVSVDDEKGIFITIPEKYFMSS